MSIILLVDDNQDNQEIYCILLERLGHTCHRAWDGATGVQMARTVAPDLILLDIAMPVMDGWEAIQVLRRDPKTAAIPVVALTALAFPADEARAIELGFDRYLRKPIAPQAVIAAIEELLRQGLSPR